jgi:hypothetical protein
LRKKELHGIAFVEAHHVGPRQRPIVIHLKPSWTTGDAGAANAIAQAWHNPRNKVSSCHYVVDESQTLRCLSDYRASFPIDDEPYKNAITINVCYDPPSMPSEKTLSSVAMLVARLCKLHNIKVRYIHHNTFSWFKRHSGIIISDLWGISEEEFLSKVQSNYVSL